MGRSVVVAVLCVVVVVSGAVHDDTQVSQLREEVNKLKRRGIKADLRKISNQLRGLESMLRRVERGVAEQKVCLRDQGDSIQNIMNHCCVGDRTSGSTESPSENVISTTEAPDQQLSPTVVVVVGTTRTTIELVMTPSSNYGDREVTWYQVRHNTSGYDVVYSVVGSQTDIRHFVVTGLVPNTQYTFQVTAWYSANDGEIANVTAKTLRGTVPSAPVVNIGELTNNSVELLMSKPASDEDVDVDSYVIVYPRMTNEHRFNVKITPPVTRFWVNSTWPQTIQVQAAAGRETGPEVLVLASPLSDRFVSLVTRGMTT
ncbi:uncharacterized protein LOC124152307 isoform X1 [Haliotis rufescens]|uniref:uncharacterized protein LOC124152307 isoform X1 n=1 Tax=Haliotis rufescens TaxID=6454 RepID=UPI00201E89FE|nr:uncharacterized protein LOC124152307 isoform X1 [Haliotis rufescens]